MIVVDTPIGKVSALPEQEDKIAAMSDEELCRQLNQRPCDPFVFEARVTRQNIRINNNTLLYEVKGT